jgi:hypothetical protein
MLSTSVGVSLFLLLVNSTPLYALDVLGMGPEQGTSGTNAPVSTETVQPFPRETFLPEPDEIPRGDMEGVEFYKQRELSPPVEETDIIHTIEEDSSVQDPSSSLYFDVIEPSAPSQFAGFRGIGSTNWYPPDPILAVGPEHIIAMVNTSWAIFDKAGNKLFQSTFSNWWSDVSPPGTPFDPVCIYDIHADRWVLLAVARKTSTNESSYLISVSDDSNPLGSWWNWNLDATLNGSTSTTNWADYPKMGYDSLDASGGAIYVTSNQYGFSGAFKHAKLRILKKSELYWTGSGGSLTWTDFWNWQNANGSPVFTWMPVHTLTSTDEEFLVNTESPSLGSTLSLWAVTDPAGASPALTRLATVNIGTYSAPPDAVQPSPGLPLDTIDSRLMQPAVYRSGYIYGSFPEAHNWGSGTVSALRLLKISTGSASAVLNTTYGFDGFYYFFPSIYVDESDNIALVFNRTSPTEFAGIHYTGRLATDTTIQGSALLKAGQSSYQRVDSIGRNRWGDYNGIGLDPADNKTFWMISEYAKGFTEWDTWIGGVTFDAKDITVSAPNGGEIWYAGDSETITWNSNNAGPDVRIEISRDGGFSWSTIVASTPNSGSLMWSVSGPLSTTCRIRITSLNFPSITDESDAGFEIKATCDGDFDREGDVDGLDLLVFIANFGRPDCLSGPPCAGDFDGNGVVDESDLPDFAANFGRIDCF